MSTDLKVDLDSLEMLVELSCSLISCWVHPRIVWASKVELELRHKPFRDQVDLKCLNPTDTVEHELRACLPQHILEASKSSDASVVETSGIRMVIDRLTRDLGDQDKCILYLGKAAS